MTPVRPKKALGQHFLVDRNVLGVIERLAGLDSDRRRARGRAGPRCPDDLPRRQGAARPRRRARSLARRRAPRGTRRPVERRRRLRRRDGPRHRPARPAADEARRQPPVQRRHAARRRVADRGRPHRVLVRDGAARGRRAVLRPAGDEGVRRRLRARAAPRARAPASIPCHGRCSVRRPTSTRRSSRSSGSRLPRMPGGCCAS